MVHKNSENLCLADSVTATDRPRSTTRLLSSAFAVSPAALCRLNARQSPGTAVKPCPAQNYTTSKVGGPIYVSTIQMVTPVVLKWFKKE